MNPDRFVLRKAGGLYWLLDTEQEGPNYKRPVALNSVGADIFNMIKEGKDREDIIGALKSKYETDENNIREDVEDFLRMFESAVSEKEKG